MYLLKKRIWSLLDVQDNKWSKLLDVFLIFLIATNVIGVIIFSGTDAFSSKGFSKYEIIFNAYHKTSIFLFTLEYILRIWSVTESGIESYKSRLKGRITFMCSNLQLLDLVAIFPFYANYFMNIDPEVHNILKTIVAFKLTRYWPKMIDYFMILLISSNVVAIVLESIESLNVLYNNWFETFYISSIMAFSVEYIIRIMAVGLEKPKHERALIKDKLNYMKSNLAIIDLLAVLPFYISIFYYIEQPILLVMRLVVILKLTRYSSAMTLLMTVLRQEIKTFTATLFIMLVVALFSSGVIYIVEKPYQPEKLGSIPEALYWTIITLTTIGYGDVAPVTALGQFFTVFVAIAAIGITALPAGILASAISEYIRRTRKAYEQKVEKVMRDGKLTDAERSELEKEGQALGLDNEEAGKIIEYTAHLGRAVNSCPHCGKPLTANKRKIRTSNTRETTRRR